MEVTRFESLLSGHEIAAAYFWSQGCGKCRLLGPRIESVFKEKCIAYYAFDVGAAQELALRYDVLGLPTLIFFRTGREELRLTPGNISVAVVEKACDTFALEQRSGQRHR